MAGRPVDGLCDAVQCQFGVAEIAAMAAISFSFVGGPASYYAGEKLGGMMLAEPLWISLGAIGVLWAIAFPALLVIARITDPDGPPAQKM